MSRSRSWTFATAAATRPPTEWAEAHRRLEEAEVYWLSTLHPEDTARPPVAVRLAGRRVVFLRRVWLR